MKVLYDLRSRIAHGDLSFKRGSVIDWNSSIISAKTTVISMTDLSTIAQVVTGVFRAVLASDVLMTALQSNKERRKKSVDNYFLAKLFSQ